MDWSRSAIRTCAAKDPYGCAMAARLLVEEGTTPDDLALARTKLELACDELAGPPCRFFA